MKMTKTKYNPAVCWCGGKRVEQFGHDLLEVQYRYWKCTKCGEKVLDMEQLHEAANVYQKLKKAKLVRISKWGNAIAIRIPKEIVQEQKLKPGSTARIFPEKVGFKVIPEKD